jgi:hypothetical protein
LKFSCWDLLLFQRDDADHLSALVGIGNPKHLDASRYLIEVGADLDSTDPAGNSILMGVAFLYRGRNLGYRWQQYPGLF